jgi:hypothetical protein
MSGVGSPAAAKISMTWSDATARDPMCRIAWSISPDARRSLVDVLAMAARTA